MSDKLVVSRVDEAYIRVRADPGIMMELSDAFTFDVPGARFTPAYKNRGWDGKIKLFHQLTGCIYTGLRERVRAFAEKRGYEYEEATDFSTTEFSVKEADAFIDALRVPEKFERRDYQVKSFVQCVRDGRALLLSPTNSGKSFIIYLLIRWHSMQYSTRALVIVPRLSLVHQLESDFRDYGLSGDCVFKITGGVDKNVEPPAITITTWQSVYKMPKEWFDQFDLVVGDEAHEFKAKSLISIMTKLSGCRFRFGTTGTLDGAETNELVLEGLFGPVRRFITSAELIEQKFSADFDVKAIVLKHDGRPKDSDYAAEMKYLEESPARNRFLKNLALSLKGNTLLLFQHIERHGQVLHDMISAEAGDRSVHFIHGDIDVDEREEIRRLLETEDDAVLCASYGTFSMGVNAPNLRNTVFASPYKSKIKVLQSIGRGLRRTETKTRSTLFDISDDMSVGRRKNHTLGHFLERVKIYSEEDFPFKIYPVCLK